MIVLLYVDEPHRGPLKRECRDKRPALNQERNASIVTVTLPEHDTAPLPALT